MRPVKLTLGLLVLVLVILLVSVGIIWYENYGPQSQSVLPNYTSTNTPYKALMSGNESFVRAQSAYSSGDYAEAQILYQQALGQATDVIQRGQIEFMVASALARQKNYQLAIPLFKSIIQDKSYVRYTIVKAYSVQTMVELYYASGDPAVARLIFSDEPYKTMLSSSNGDTELAFKKLEDYGAVFRPLGIMELRLASWYVNDHIANPSATSSVSVMNIVQNAVKYADADIETSKNDPNLGTQIPTILSRECALYLRVYDAKLDTADNANTVCKKALDTFTAVGQTQLDGYTRYYYAVLLAEEGNTSQAISVLQPLSGNQYSGQDVISFLKSERSNQLLQKSRIVMLANISPDFKKLLISLGWNAQDFASNS